jgi:probable blue pigment (indigoidine) exporter
MPTAAGRHSVAGPFITLSTSSAPGLLAIAAAGPILLASAYVLTAQLPASPLWNAITRILPAGLLLLALHPSLPTGVWWRRSLLLGALNFGGFFALQAFSLHRIPGGVAATIAAMQTLLVPLGATALLGDRLRWSQLAAAGAGVVGIALLVLRSTEHLDPPGVATATLLAVCTATGMLLTRRWGLPPNVHHTTATAWQMLAGGILLLPAALLAEGTPPSMTAIGWSVTVWLAAGGTALAFAIIFGAMHRGLAPVSVSRLMLLCPLVATAAGWIVYRQTLTPLQLLGAALVLVSVATAARDQVPRPDRQGRLASTSPLRAASTPAATTSPRPVSLR